MFLTLLQNRRAPKDNADGTYDDRRKRDERLAIALLLVAGSP